MGRGYRATAGPTRDGRPAELPRYPGRLRARPAWVATYRDTAREKQNYANDTVKHVRPEKHEDARDGHRRDADRQLSLGELAWLSQPLLGHPGGEYH